MNWAPGFTGGTSETILGNWLMRRKCRSRMIIASAESIAQLEQLVAERN